MSPIADMRVKFMAYVKCPTCLAQFVIDGWFASSTEAVNGLNVPRSTPGPLPIHGKWTDATGADVDRDNKRGG